MHQGLGGAYAVFHETSFMISGACNGYACLFCGLCSTLKLGSRRTTASKPITNSSTRKKEANDVESGSANVV